MDSITTAQRTAAAGAITITAPGLGYLTLFNGDRLAMCYVGDSWVIDNRAGWRQDAPGCPRTHATGRKAQSAGTARKAR